LTALGSLKSIESILLRFENISRMMGQAPMWKVRSSAPRASDGLRDMCA
jgi:hypothetical protein